MLTGVAAIARVPARLIARRASVVLPLVVLAAAALPLVRDGGARLEVGPLVLWEEGLLALAAVAAKASIGTLSAVLLGATTSFPQVLRALEQLRVPRLFVVIARRRTATCRSSSAKSAGRAAPCWRARSGRATPCRRRRSAGSPARCSCARMRGRARAPGDDGPGVSTARCPLRPWRAPPAAMSSSRPRCRAP